MLYMMCLFDIVKTSVMKPGNSENFNIQYFVIMFYFIICVLHICCTLMLDRSGTKSLKKIKLNGIFWYQKYYLVQPCILLLLLKKG